MNAESKPESVAEYISRLPAHCQGKILELREILNRIAPEAKEKIKWGKPVLESRVILFAYSAHQFHLSFFPTGPALRPFLSELSDYKLGKDSIQFPYHRDLPVKLIEKIAAFRKMDVEKNSAKWKYR